MSELFSVLQWWIILFSLGLVFLPLTTLIFHSFADRGYIFAKILGLLLLGYSIWLLSSLKILPFSTLSIFLVLGVFLAVNSFLSRKHGIFANLRPILPMIILEEALFTLGLIFWAWVRSFEPSIHGLEKFMDFGFMNSILRTDYFPPKDLWLTPLSINYYYFGHFITALLIKVSGVRPEISYNIMVAALFGLTLATSFSIGANLYHFFTGSAKLAVNRRLIIVSGLLSSFLVTLGGNLHTIYAFFQNYPVENPVPFWQLPLSLNFSSYWYPNATRFIPLTIHEFPIYSFVVSDLHGHVLGIPFILLLIALLIKIFFSPKLPTAYYLLLALLIGTVLMTNVLDGPIYLLVIFAVLLAKSSLKNAAKASGLILLGAAIFSLPFWLAFKPFGAGIGVLCAPQFLTKIGKLGPFLFEANHCARSPLWMLAILWGLFYFVIAGFLIFVLKIKGPFRLLSSIFKPSSRGTLFHLPLSTTDILILTLALTATVLISIPEFLYVKDIYPAHYRANTIFKFGYQAFIILGLISGFMITRLLSLKNLPYRLIFIALFFLVAFYPYFAINSYYGGLKNSQGLDGLQWLNKQYPADYKAILWLRENIKDQPVILEAQGDSYTDFARVSANSGLPTVIGWPVHEWLWRGSYDEAGKRSGEVTTIYESEDPLTTQQLLQKYNVEYVFIGTLERQKYPKLNEAKFQSLGKAIFEDGQTRIYQLN